MAEINIEHKKKKSPWLWILLLIILIIVVAWVIYEFILEPEQQRSINQIFSMHLSFTPYSLFSLM